ncbi:MAG: hypothetical protein AAF488_15775 [Planctomycetota bacterium]
MVVDGVLQAAREASVGVLLVGPEAELRAQVQALAGSDVRSINPPAPSFSNRLFSR